jgi:hypothetical protein
METVDSIINTNVTITRKYFGISPQDSQFNRLDQALAEVGATNLPKWERRSAARKVADAYADVEYAATARREKDEAREYAAVWVDIRNMLA